MTLHAHHLHAFTAIAALARSWPLARRAAGQVSLGASDGLRSPTYGRTSSGGVSDGGMLDAVRAGVDERRRWTLLLDRIAQDVTDALWLARASTQLRPTRGPLGILAGALPACPPAYARDIGQALAGADRSARAALQLDLDRLPLVGVPCPRCDTRLLEARTSALSRAGWTVVCGAGCGGIWRWTVIAASHVREFSRARVEDQEHHLVS